MFLMVSLLLLLPSIQAGLTHEPEKVFKTYIGSIWGFVMTVVEKQGISLQKVLISSLLIKVIAKSMIANSKLSFPFSL